MGGCLLFSLFCFLDSRNSVSTDEKMPGLGVLGRGATATSNGIIIIKKDVNGRQAGVVMVCLSALGVEEVDAEEEAGLAGAPGLQFRGPPQLLRYTLGSLAEDGDPRGELTLVHRVGE